MDTSKGSVLVAGRNYGSNLGMVRALGEAGYEVDVLHIFHTTPKRAKILKLLQPQIEKYSKYVNNYQICITNRKPETIIDKLLRSASAKKMLIFPTDDLTAGIIDENYDQLKERYLLPNVENTQGKLLELMNKEFLKKKAAAAGISVVAGKNICLNETKIDDNLLKEIKFPCFIKPTESRNSAKTVLQKCETKDILKRALTALQQAGEKEILVEDYVPITNEYSILGLSTVEMTISPGFFRAEKYADIASNGVAMTGLVLPTKQQKELIEKINRFVNSLNYTGLFDVDLMEDENGEIYFVELNLRYGGSGYAITKCGMNLPGQFADYMINHTPVEENYPDVHIPDCGVYFVNENILLDQYSKGRIAKSDIVPITNRADIHFIWDNEDRRPYRYFKKFFLPAKLLRMRKHV